MSKSTEEGMSPVDKGRNRYKQKEYRSALEAFTEAVNHSHGNILFTALDYRAATYEKLDQLQNALRDSKQMIDLNPDLAKGYLRCAKVLQLKGEKELALKIYERGLNKVKVGADDSRITLQIMFNKLRQSLDIGTTRDPLEHLPLEMAQIVINHLNMRDRVICLAVSKSWKRLLESSHEMWTTLDTSRARKPISKTSLKLHLRRSNYTLRKAIINSRSDFDASKLTFLTKTCKQLEELEFNGSGVIGTSLVAAIPFAKNLTSIIVSASHEIHMSSVFTVLNACKETITQASFLRVSKGNAPPPSECMKLDALTVLKLNMRAETLVTPLDSILLKYAPNLTLLAFSGSCATPCTDLSTFKCLADIQLIDTNMNLVPSLPPSTKYLDLSDNPGLTCRMVHPELDQDVSCFNDLVLLESFNCESTNLTGEDIRNITRSSIKAGNLKKLFIGSRRHDEGTQAIEDEYPASETVEELSLKHLYLSEKRVMGIVGRFPNLKVLDVSYNNKITGVAVKSFVESGITWLTLDECSKISLDAVDYAREKGVRVEFDFPSRIYKKSKTFRDSFFNF